VEGIAWIEQGIRDVRASGLTAFIALECAIQSGSLVNLVSGDCADTGSPARYRAASVALESLNDLLLNWLLTGEGRKSLCWSGRPPWHSAREYATLGVQIWRSGGSQSHPEDLDTPVVACLCYQGFSE
jgi:hypothetical protein